MELFYSSDISGGRCLLNQEESTHCMKVLRHKVGDIINVIDGCGSLMECRICTAGKNSAELEIVAVHENFGAHDYNLTMAVSPTKNMDRYEWFLEKATEIGTDRIVPVIGDHSERKIVKAERCNKILLSAAKQSLKGAVPQLDECCSVKDFIGSFADDELQADGTNSVLKLIAYCGEATKLSVKEAVSEYLDKRANGNLPLQIAILIGPEGDFSPQEVEKAVSCGFVPVHLGKSRLRTETAAVVACSEIYSLLG